MKRLLLLSVISFLGACSSTAKEGTLICAMTMSACLFEAIPVKVDKDCANEPKPILPNPIEVNSVAVYHWRALPWLNPKRFPRGVGGPGMGFESLAPILIDSRYDFIELKTPPAAENLNLYSGYMNLTNGIPAEFVRISLRKTGHPYCAQFEKTLEKEKRWLPASLKKAGLPDNTCISVEIISKPISRYAFNVIEDEHARDSKYRWQILDTETHQPFAQILHHVARGIDCPKQEIRSKFLSLLRQASPLKN